MHAQYFRQGDKEVNRSPLAKKLLKIAGVMGVFLGRNFITITKTPDIIWQVRQRRLDSTHHPSRLTDGFVRSYQ